MQILSTLAASQSQPNPTQPGLSQTLASQLSSRAAASSDTTASAPTSGDTSAPAANSPDQLTSEGTFLQLLVAQIKNQDPLNPTDSIQFVGQLVQYSQLEQLLGINQGIKTLVGSGTPATPSPTQPTSGS